MAGNGATTDPYISEGTFGTGLRNGNGGQGIQLKKGKLAFQVEKEVDSTDSINIFSSATDSAAAKASFESPTSFLISNTGDAGLGLSLKVPYFSNDTTAATSRYVQFFLGQGQTIDLGTTRFITSLNAGFNSGTVVSSFTTPSSDLYIDSTSDMNAGEGGTHVIGSATATNLWLPEGEWTDAGNCSGNRFRVGDLIRVNNEIMSISGIGSMADGTTNNYLTVARGIAGSTAVDTHSAGQAIMFAFHNNTAAYNKFSTVCTDSRGSYASTNFFGLGRGLTIAASGIVPGSVALKFYSAPYQEMGVSGLTSQSNSGLTSGSTYYIKVAVNGGTAYEVGFTVDSTSIGGANGILAKIQAVLDAQYYTTGSVLNGKRVTVGLVNGDIRWTFHERKVGSTIALTLGTSGADTTTELLAQAIGVFPAAAEAAVPTSLPADSIFKGAGYEDKPNTDNIMYDDGNGNLVAPFGSGVIDYETGNFRIRAYENAEFQYVVAHTSGMGGRASSSKGNIIEEVYARSTNPKVTSKVVLEVRV